MKWQVLKVLVSVSDPMVKECRYFLLAIGFFTRIPTPTIPDFKEEELNEAAKYFPAVGMLVGLVGALVFFLAKMVFPISLAVLLSMVATIYVTGAFHEDGLADSADGIGGGWTREQILTIMQDSRLGTYGAVALVGMLFLKFQSLVLLPASLIPLVLFAGHALSRLAAVWIMATADYIKLSGKSKPLATQIRQSHLWVAHVFGLLPWLGWVVLMVLNQHAISMIIKFVILSMLPVLLVWLWWRAKLMRHLQGYTGDTLGATQQLTELAFYLGILAWSLH